MLTQMRALLMRGWTEIPEVIGSGAMGVIGYSGGLYMAYVYDRDRQIKHEHRFYYTVYRDDDPRAKNVGPFKRDDLRFAKWGY